MKTFSARGLTQKSDNLKTPYFSTKHGNHEKAEVIFYQVWKSMADLEEAGHGRIQGNIQSFGNRNTGYRSNRISYIKYYEYSLE